MKKILFLDRDGTLIVEPKDFQIDSLEKLQLVDFVIPSLLELKNLGFRFVMVSNQDGLGTPQYPQESFDQVQKSMMQILESQGILFDDILICPHTEQDKCLCRKPHMGLVTKYLSDPQLDRKQSCVIGDRETDLVLAKNMGLQGYRLTNEFSWKDIVAEIKGKRRIGKITRKTKETNISVTVDLDSQKASEISTGIEFFDHMLDQVSKHGGFYLNAQVKGDVEVDEHHTVEDTAIAIGEAIKDALGDKFGIGRYGFTVPMDEARADVAIDLSARPFLVFNGNFDREYVGKLPTELVPHFFRSFSDSLGATLHISVTGENTHHKVESCFKGLGRALRQALSVNSSSGIPSTKGTL